MNKDQIIGLLKTYPFAVGCALLAVGAGVGLFLRGGAAEELSVVEADLQSSKRTMDQNVKNATGLDEDLEMVESLVEKIESRLFEKDQRSKNINFFYGFEKRLDVVFSSVAQANQSDPIYDEKGPRALKEYSTLVYNIVATSSFGDMVLFIEELGRVDSLIRVADYRLTDVESPEVPDAVEAQLRLIVMAPID